MLHPFVVRDINLADMDQDFQKHLSAGLDQLGYSRRQSTGPTGWARTGGSWFPLNPNRLRHLIRWELVDSDRKIRFTLTAIALPWMERRVRLLLDGLANRLENHLTENRRGDGFTRGFQIIPPPSEPGFTLSLASVFLSVLLGTLMAAMVNLVFGYGIIGETLEYLRAKASLLTSFAPLSLPPKAHLDAITVPFLWGCSLFFALTIGTLSGLVASLLLLLGEFWPRFSRLSLWTVVTTTVALGAYTYRAEALCLNIVCTAALPLSILFGYSLGWGIRGAWCRRTSPRFRQIAVLIFIVLLAVQAGIVWKQKGGKLDGENLVRDFVEFRDRKLLNTAGGRWLSEFYYSHTLYPAEVIKPPALKTEKSTLVFSDEERSCQAVSRLIENPKRHLLCIHDPDDVLRKVAGGGIDYLLMDTSSKGIETILGRSQSGSVPGHALRAAILFGKAEAIESLRNKYNLAPGTEFVPAPLDSRKLNAAIDSCSINQDKNRNLRLLVKVSLFAVLAWLWIMATSTKMLLVAGPLLFLLVVGARIWKHGWPAPRWILLALGLVLSGCLGYRTYLYQPSVTKEIVEIRSFINKEYGSPGKLCDYLEHPDPAVRYEAVYGMWRMPPKGRLAPCQQELISGLEDPDPRVRIWCAMNLGHRSDEKTREALAKALWDPVINVRCKAALALGRAGNQASLRPLETKIEQGDTWYARQHLVAARRRLLQRFGPILP